MGNAMLKRTIIEYESSETGRTAADTEIVLNFLNEALAAEIYRVLQYKRQEAIATDVYADSIAFEFQGLALAEQVHVNLIMERIARMKGVLNLTLVGNRLESGSHPVERGSLQEMIKDDWVAKRMSIDAYGKMIPVIKGKDPTTFRMLENIMASEKVHADTLLKLIASFSPENLRPHSRVESNVNGRLPCHDGLTLSWEN